MKPEHTPDSTHGRGAEDYTSWWSCLRRLVAAAIVAATAAGALAGCGRAEADADDGRHTAAEENSLPPGVMPPNDPPQPGDAPLGPDGHYDYSAPGFELKNPCDTDAYQVALQNGWEPPVIGNQLFDSESDRMCGIVKNGDGIGITHHSFTRSELIDLDPKVETQTKGETTWYTVVWPNYIGSTCFAGIDTSSGAEGVTVPIGGFSNFTTRESACQFASEQFIQFFGGKYDL